MRNSPLRIDQLKNIISRLYNKEGRERIGFIVGSEIIEVVNYADEGEHGWLVSADDNIKYAEKAYATWHTHPSHTANLGGDDNQTFKEWPELVHFIIGDDGVKAYQFSETKQAVIELE